MRLTLDFGHADRSAGIAETIGDFTGLVRHVHIHDSDGKKDHQEIGRATVDFASFSATLRSHARTSNQSFDAASRSARTCSVQ